MKIQQIMSTPVDLVEPGTTIRAAAEKMRDDDIGCLLIGKEDQLLGLLTDRDLAVRALADGRNAAHEPVWTVMSTDVLCCFEDQTVDEVARVMAEHGIRRLPVVDRQHRLAGIVSSSDVHGGESRHKPWQVTYYKELTDSRGTVHEVPLVTIYVAVPDSEDGATAVAGRILDEAWCDSQWKRAAADGCRVVGGIKSPSLPPRRRPIFARSGRLGGHVREPWRRESGTADQQWGTG